MAGGLGRVRVGEIGAGDRAAGRGGGRAGGHVGGRDTSAAIWTFSSCVGKAEVPGKVRPMMWGRQFSCLLTMGLGVLQGSPDHSHPEPSTAPWPGAGGGWATHLGRDTAGQGLGEPPPRPQPPFSCLVVFSSGPRPWAHRQRGASAGTWSGRRGDSDVPSSASQPLLPSCCPHWWSVGSEWSARVRQGSSVAAGKGIGTGGVRGVRLGPVHVRCGG